MDSSDAATELVKLAGGMPVDTDRAYRKLERMFALGLMDRPDAFDDAFYRRCRVIAVIANAEARELYGVAISFERTPSGLAGKHYAPPDRFVLKREAASAF